MDFSAPGGAVPAASGTRGGLSAQIVRVTLLVGAVTVIAAIVVSLVSVSRVTSENMRSREARVLQLLNDGIESRLRNVSMSVDQAMTLAFSSGDTRPVQEIITLSHSSNRSRISQILVADQRGRVLASSPKRATSARGLEPFRQARAGRGGFQVVRTADGEGWQLWLTRTAIGRNGEPLFVLTELDTDFVGRLVKEASAGLGEHSLVVLDARRVVLTGDQNVTPQLDEARWTASSPAAGSVTAQGAKREMLEGSYNDVGQLEGLNWRIVLVHPASARFAENINTVGPPVLVLLTGGAVALILAWVLSVRITRPLRELERSALAAASGAYVRPISRESDDEIGQVAKAFNAVALRLNALHDLSQLLASASRLDQVLDGILAAVGHLVGPGSAAIYLLEEGPTFVPVRTRGRELARAEPVRALDSGWLNSALATSDPVKYSGSPEDLKKELPGFSGGRVEALAAPLVAGREQLGVIVVARDEERPLSEGEREMLRTFSAQASVAVHTSRLFAEETLSRRTAEALRQVAEELVRPASLESSLSVVEGIVADLFGATRAAIVLVDRELLGIKVSGASAEETAVLGAAYRALGTSEGGTGVVVDRGVDPGIDELITNWGCDQLLVVPVALDTNHGAVLVVGLCGGGVNALRIGEALADEVALALDNAYFYQRAVTRAANLETIFRISQAVGSSLQVNVVLNRVLDVVQKILSADGVALLSYDDRARVLKATMGRGELPGRFTSLELQPGEDLPGQVFSRGEPVAIRDLHPGMGGLAGMAAEIGLRSMLAVPLLARGRSIGVLIVFSMQPGAFMDEDVSVLQTFASQAALAIDTARLYSREHEVASVLQQSILPDDLPDYPEIEAGSVYEPAGGEAEIGGDYYDVFRADSSIWFAIGDVCGKGVYAATKTSMIKYVVRALVVAGYTPGQVMEEVNNMIAVTGDPADIVTLWLGRYEPKSGSLTWADGGHPPGLLRRADGNVERLDVTGALLGAVEGARYEEEHTFIRMGDTVLLYTDGVTEARRGNIFFGEDRVRRVLNGGSGAQEAAEKLLGAVRGYVSGALRDDVAVLVIKPRADKAEGETTNK